MMKPGDLVEVKHPDEILATLDADGTLRQLPFMPEMAGFCGTRMRVSGRPARLCISGPQVWGTMQELTSDDIVLLDDVRCSGAAHDGCQRACVLFWREAWLRPVSPSDPKTPVTSEARARLQRRLKTMRDATAYFCQGSELLKVTNTITRKTQLERCVREVRTGSTGPIEMVKRLAIWFGWRIRRKLLGEYACGRARTTPTAALNLEPGDWVEVKPMASIRETLDPRGYNRGLYFSPDMRLACGGRFRVADRVDRIIEDGTGKMRRLYNTVALEGSLCSCPHINIGGCSRADIVYWREIWLRRVAPPRGEPREACRRSDIDSSVAR